MCKRYLHVTILFLIPYLGPQVLLLLQLLGHLQVLLHQTALMDVGRQVALDCGHKHIQVLLYKRCTQKPEQVGAH